MLYHLLAPLAKQHIFFNLFNYLTFRAAGAVVTALLLAFLCGPAIMRRLRERNVGQVIRAEGPASHHTKRGTPTMGGLIIILATVVPTLLWARLDSRYVVVAVIAMLWAGAIGFLDDYLKIVRGKSQGLVARWKLIGQVTFGVALGIALILWPLAPDLPPTSTQLPVFKYMLLVLPPPLYLLFVTVVVTGTSNAVNLTDGLDGLAAGLAAILAGTFAAFAYVFGRIDWTRYLGVYFLPGSQELTIFCGALAGAALGFLWFNAHPAQVFMGDTGSLAIGAGLAALALTLNTQLLLPIIGALFVFETFSVIVQVGSFRIFHRRVFRMAPVHHHFELGGWPETTVIIRFWMLGLMATAVALGIYYADFVSTGRFD